MSDISSSGSNLSFSLSVCLSVQWDTKSSCSPPVILDGGYDAWHLSYSPLCVGKWVRKGTEPQKNEVEPKMNGFNSQTTRSVDIAENGFDSNSKLCSTCNTASLTHCLSHSLPLSLTASLTHLL